MFSNEFQVDRRVKTLLRCALNRQFMMGMSSPKATAAKSLILFLIVNVAHREDYDDEQDQDTAPEPNRITEFA